MQLLSMGMQQFGVITLITDHNPFIPIINHHRLDEKSKVEAFM